MRNTILILLLLFPMAAWGQNSVNIPGGSTSDPVVPGDGELDITGDLDISGTISAAALAIDDNATLNASTLKANEGGGSDMTCANQGTTDTLTTYDQDDTNNANEWVVCDGATRLGSVGRLQVALWEMNDASATAADGYFCPMMDGQPNDIERGGNVTESQCSIPIGWEVRFYSLGFTLSSGTTDDTEECRFSIICATEKAAGGPGTIIMDSVAGGDAYVYTTDSANPPTTSRSRGYSQEIAIDPTAVCNTYWQIHVDEGPGATCDKLQTVNGMVVYEYSRVN